MCLSTITSHVHPSQTSDWTVNWYSVLLWVCSALNLVFLFLCLSVGKLPQRSSLWALSLSLSAVNLSESAQAKMAPVQLTQIYVTAAIALRTVLGHHLSFLPVGSRTLNKLRRWYILIVLNILHNTILFFLLSRVIFWAVQKVLPPNLPLTACAGSSPHWGGSSSWAVIGQWSPRAPARYTLLRETQVCHRRKGCFEGALSLTVL